MCVCLSVCGCSEAIVAFQRAIELNANDSVAHYFMATLHTDGHADVTGGKKIDYARALQHCRRAVALRHPEAMRLLGDFYAEVHTAS